MSLDFQGPADPEISQFFRNLTRQSCTKKTVNFANGTGNLCKRSWNAHSRSRERSRFFLRGEICKGDGQYPDTNRGDAGNLKPENLQGTGI